MILIDKQDKAILLSLETIIDNAAIDESKICQSEGGGIPDGGPSNDF